MAAFLEKRPKIKLKLNSAKIWGDEISTERGKIEFRHSF